MMDLPSMMSGQRDDEPHGLEPGHWCEHLLEVDTRTLHVSLRNEAGLVLDDVPALVLLHLVHPLEADRAVARWKLGERPSFVVVDGLEFFKHRTSPAVLTVRFDKRRGLLPCHQVQFLVIGHLQFRGWLCSWIFQ
jgi:hypothetical protein